MHHCGAACAEISDLYLGAIETRNDFARDKDPDKRFAAFKRNYYNRPDFIKKGRQITVIFKKCTCPLVKEGVHDPFLCNCTIGFTKKIFESLFEKPVAVELKTSILRGDNVCRQEVELLNP